MNYIQFGNLRNKKKSVCLYIYIILGLKNEDFVNIKDQEGAPICDSGTNFKKLPNIRILHFTFTDIFGQLL